MSYRKIIFTKGNTQYKDLDISFKVNPLTNDIRTVADDNSIKQSLRNIVLSEAGSRPFDPDFGGGVYHLLFQPLDIITRDELESRLYDTIKYHEPRISIQKVSVVSQVDDNEISINIYYTIKNSNIPQSLNVILHRTR